MYNFEQMKNFDIKTVDLDTLVDIRDILIDENLPKNERILEKFISSL